MGQTLQKVRHVDGTDTLECCLDGGDSEGQILQEGFRRNGREEMEGQTLQMV